MNTRIIFQLAALLGLLATASPVVAQTSAPLSINCPLNRTNWHCGVASTAVVTYPAPTTTAACPTNAIVTCTPPSGALFILGTTTVTCRATNSCRESAVCTFTVTVARDITPPVIQCPTNRIVWLCGTATTTAVVSWPLPSATDNADTSVAVTCSPSSGSAFPLGTSTVTCTATDNCTNRTTCTFTVTVARDTLAPTINCPPSTNVTACASSGAAVNYPTPTATDNADFNVSVVCSPASGSVFPVGTTTVTCTATDDCTNRTTCTFLVRVTRDTTPPVISCPTNRVVLLCGTAATIPVTFPAPTASDTLDPSVTVTCVPASGSSFPVGTNIVVCTASDDCNNTSTCSFAVVVIRDITPPTIECPSNMVFNCLCPGNTIVLDFFKPTVTDDRDPNPTIVCVPPSLVSSPGVHPVVCTATDSCGNSNRCSFTVTFNYDTTPPVLTCPTNMTVWTCNTTAVVNYSASATDACDANVDIVCTPPSGSVFPLGVSTVSCIATDNCTNRSTCTFTVTVNRDTTPPAIVCPTNVVASICSTCAVSQCVANVPPPIRPNSVGNGLFYGSSVEPDLSLAEAEQAILQREAAGYHPIHINAHQPAGQSGTASVRFAIAWVRDDDSAFPHEATLETTTAQLQAAELAQHALRPISLSGYKTGENETRFAVAYIYDDSGYPWRLILDRDGDQFYAESVALAQQGYRAISISTYSFDGANTLFSAIFVQDGLTGIEWTANQFIPDESYQDWFDGWINLGYAPVSVAADYNISPNGSATYFAGVLARVPGGGIYVGKHGLTEAEFLTENAHWTDPLVNEYGTTLRPVVVSAYQSWFHGGEKRYVAVWRESAPRVFSTTGVTQPSLAALDTAMETFMTNNHINAATLCVSKNGGIVHHRGYTWAPYEFKQTQPCSRFRIASASKAVTAVAIMKLLEGNYFVGMKGGGLQALTLDMPLFQINGMPNLPADYGAEAANMTIRQLLQHRAGWGAAVNHFEPLYLDLSVAEAMGRSLPLSRKDRINFMMTPAFWPTPGLPSSVGFANFIVASEYSNFGFSLLAELIEVISNQPYETFVRNHVLLPAGASRTHLGNTARLHALSGPDEVVYTAGNSNPGQSRWYVSDANYNPLEILNPTTQSRVGFSELGSDFPTSAYGRYNINTIDAAGGWVSTSDDIVRLLKSFDSYNPGQPGSDTSLLDWDSMWEMWTNPENITPLLNGYALGWQREVLATPAGEVVVHSHGGNIDGAMSIIARRSDGVCFAAMFSREAGGGAFTALNSVINAITNWPVCQDGVIVNYPSPIATDNADANVSVVCVPPSGSYFPLGFNSVTCTATDNCGNQRTCQFQVTVKADSTPPSIQCPTNRVVWTCSTNGAVVTFPAPVVSDDTDANPSVVCTPPSGSLFPVGRTVVNCTATDDCTNRSSCKFTVTVNADNIRPVIVCPADQTVWTCNADGAVVNYPAPMASDNHDPNPSVVCVPPSGSLFPLGTTTVTCTATDNCTNRNVCVFRVTVNRDATPPTIQCPTNVSVFTANAAGRLVYYGPLVAADDPAASISCTPASGSLFPIGITPVVCTARDACGHERSCTFTVEVILLTLRVSPGASGPVLSWTGDAMLEAADEVVGPWLPVRDATSPYLVQFGGTKKFFRLAAPVGYADCGEVVFSPSVWNIDVPSVRIQGRFLLNGRPFPSSFLQGANFFLRRASTGDEVYLGLSNNETFDRRVVPGIYDVIYEHKIGDEVPLNSVAVVIAGLEISGDQTFDIDVPSVGVSGAFLINGVLAQAIETENGRIQWRDRQNGALTTVGETKFQSYAALMIPGSYDFMYTRITGSAVVPANALTAFRRNVSILNNGVVDMDVPMIHLTGAFTINGVLAPSDQVENGRIYLLDPDTGAKVLFGETRFQDYDMLIIPGTYDFMYSRVAGSVIVPANSNARFLTGASLQADGVFDINLPVAPISGTFRVNGVPAPDTETEKALITLRQGEDVVYLGHTTFGTFQVLAMHGTYQPTYTHITGSAIMPANTNAVLGTVVIAGATVFDINIPTAHFDADVRFNGGNFPGPIAGESARLFLEDTLTDGLIPLTFSYPAFDQPSRLVVRGTYRVRYEYESGTKLPRNTFATLGSSLSVTQNVQTVINVRAVALSGDFLLNGGAFPGGQNAAITLKSLLPGDSLYLGGTQDGAYSTVIVPGHYAAFYNWAVGDLIPRNQNARLICPR